MNQGRGKLRLRSLGWTLVYLSVMFTDDTWNLSMRSVCGSRVATVRTE